MLQLFDLVLYGIVAIVFIPIALVFVALARYLRLWRNIKHTGRQMGVRWWDAAGPFVVIIGIFAAAWLLGTPPDEGESGRLFFLFSEAFVLLGGVGLTMAIGNLDEYRQLSSSLDSAGTVDAGPVALSGTADAYEGTPSGPLSGEPALAHTLRVTERRGLGHRSASVERHYEQSTDPFTLDDGTGSVVVDPTDAAARFDGPNTGHDAVLSLPADDETEQAVVDRVSDRTDVAPDGDQYYKESRIEPGTDVTVLGTVARDPEARYPVVGDGDRRLVVFQGDVDAIRESVGNRVKWGAGLATVGFPVGAVGMFLVAGVP